MYLPRAHTNLGSFYNRASNVFPVRVPSGQGYNDQMEAVGEFYIHLHFHKKTWSCYFGKFL